MNRGNRGRSNKDAAVARSQSQPPDPASVGKNKATAPPVASDAGSESGTSALSAATAGSGPDGGTGEAHAAILETMREHMAGLEAARKAAEARLDREWVWPKRMVIAVTFLVGFAALFALAHHYRVMSELLEGKELLRSELLEASEQRKEYDSQLIDARKAVVAANDSIEVAGQKFNLMVEEQKQQGYRQVSQEITNAIKTDIVRSQRILSLVSMGREQIFLKKNPVRALVYANAAQRIYASGIPRPSDTPPVPREMLEAGDAANDELAIMNAVYPTIWNLQLECLLQSKDFAKLGEEANEVIGKHTAACLKEDMHCTLRPAFYYRSLAGIERLTTFNEGVNKSRVTDPRHKAEYDKQFLETQADLMSAIGPEPDRSIGMIYLALLYIAEGKYAKCDLALKDFTPATNAHMRQSSDHRAAAQLASTTLELSRFIQAADLRFTSINCNLGTDVLSEWDAHLLERLIREIVIRRQWHLDSAIVPNDPPVAEQKLPDPDESLRLTDQLALHCVEWILAIRQACTPGQATCGPNSGPCGGDVIAASTGGSELGQAKAELLADLRLRAHPEGPIYSRDGSLGRSVGGSLWMKLLLHVPYTESRTRTRVDDDGEEQEEWYNVTLYRTEERFVRFARAEEISAGPYVRVSDDDLPEIHRLKDRAEPDLTAPAVPMAPAPTPPEA